MKALKFNPKSKEFWLEYIKLELKILAKLKERKAIIDKEAASGGTYKKNTEIQDEEEEDHQKRDFGGEDFVELDEAGIVDENDEGKGKKSSLLTLFMLILMQ